MWYAQSQQQPGDILRHALQGSVWVNKSIDPLTIQQKLLTIGTDDLGLSISVLDKPLKKLLSDFLCCRFLGTLRIFSRLQCCSPQVDWTFAWTSAAFQQLGWWFGGVDGTPSFKGDNLEPPKLIAMVHQWSKVNLRWLTLYMWRVQPGCGHCWYLMKWCSHANPESTCLAVQQMLRGCSRLFGQHLQNDKSGTSHPRCFSFGIFKRHCDDQSDPSKKLPS